MNKLIWKELHEMRLIPVAIAAMVAMVLIVNDAISAWMASNGFGFAPMALKDCTLFLLLGLAGSGIFAGSVAIAPETGSGTLAFLSSLPIGRPRIWTAKVIAGVVIMASSAVTVTLCWGITVFCLFHGEWRLTAMPGRYDPILTPFGMQDPVLAGTLTDALSDWICASALHAATATFAVVACLYCAALLVSTLTDRTATAGIVAMIASVGVAGGLLCILNALGSHVLTLAGLTATENNPNSLQAEAIACTVVVIGLLSTSFVAFCYGDSLRTRRRLGIAAVLMLGWLTTSGVAFAAYGRYWQAPLTAIAVRKSDAFVANRAEHDRQATVVAAPLFRGQHWTVFFDHAVINDPFPRDGNGRENDGTGWAVIHLMSNDLDTPGAVPVNAIGGNGVQPVVIHQWSHRPDNADIQRMRDAALQAAVQRGMSGRTATAQRIAPGHYVASVLILYTPDPPAGQLRRAVKLYDKRGRMIGAINIVADKVPFVDHCKAAPGGTCSDD
jgi:hypothetical protein